MQENNPGENWMIILFLREIQMFTKRKHFIDYTDDKKYGIIPT